MKIAKRLREHLKEFLKSFRLDKRFLWAVFIDILMVLALVFSAGLFGNYFKKKASAIIPVAQLKLNLPADQMQAYSSQMQGLIVFFVVGVIVYLLFALLIWAAAQGQIWNIINRRRSDYRYFKKLFLMNLFLVPIYLVIFFILSVITTGLIALLGFIAAKLAFGATIVMYFFMTLFSILIISPIILYVTNSLNLIYYNFSKEQLIIKSIIKMFSQLSLKYYVPHVFMSIIMLALAGMSLAFKNVGIYMFIYAALFIIFFAWLRFYLKKLVE